MAIGAREREAAVGSAGNVLAHKNIPIGDGSRARRRRRRPRRFRRSAGSRRAVHVKVSPLSLSLLFSEGFRRTQGPCYGGVGITRRDTARRASPRTRHSDPGREGSCIVYHSPGCDSPWANGPSSSERRRTRRKGKGNEGKREGNGKGARRWQG